MARPFYRFEKIDEIINYEYELFTKEVRKKIYRHPIEKSHQPNAADMQLFYDNAIEYFIDKQQLPQHADTYSNLIATVLGIERHSDVHEISETSKNKIKTLVDKIWALMRRYETMNSGEVHQIWMDTQRKMEKKRADSAIFDVRRTYEIYNMGEWLSMDTWTPTEAAAISMQIEPRFALDLPENFDEDTIRDFGKALTGRTDEIVRALNTDIFKNGIITPKVFMAWASKKGWMITHKNLRLKEGDFSTNTKHRFYSILIAVALEKFDMELQTGPKFAICGKVSKIALDCQKWNLNVSEKSIRGYLDDAVKWAQEDRSDAITDAYNRNKKIK
jgi:hypothetical protein